MKNLLYKEFRLSAHPAVFIFPVFALMLMIPSYPYYIAFIYSCLAIFLSFMSARENRDTIYTSLLPVRKRDAVKARCLFVVIVELFQVAVSIPFAMISVRINPLGSNTAGIEANVAFYGLVLVMYSVFNLIFIPMHYKTAYNLGVPFLVGGLAVLVYIAAAELMVAAVPALKTFLDTSAADKQLMQLPVLLAGAAIYALAAVATFKLSAARFEKADIR